VRVSTLAIDDVTIRPNATTTTFDLVLPPDAGTNGYALKTDGLGNLSWGVVGTGDFLSNGSIPMTGHLDLGSNDLLNGRNGMFSGLVTTDAISIVTDADLGGVFIHSQGGSPTVLRTAEMTGGNHVETTTNGSGIMVTTTDAANATETTNGLREQVVVSPGNMVAVNTLDDLGRQGTITVTDQTVGTSSLLQFQPNLNAIGTPGMFFKGSGTFRIDHPLDPYNKYLFHSFVESPDMMNIYNGNVTTDASGEAVIVMPDYFEALNRDFRYQLTVIGDFAQAAIADEIKDRRFTIKTDKPNVKVSWQVTGVRQDTFAEENRIVVEVDKEPEKKGTLLYEPSHTVKR